MTSYILFDATKSNYDHEIARNGEDPIPI